jgi:predicted nucleotidyltransferase component of viral defense system
MLRLNEIKSFFPDSLHRYPQFMLREYLQYKILDIVFSSDFGTDLCFLGGTCLRIVHGNRRFSEDIDFDNRSLKENEFTSVTELIQKQLARQGFEVQIKAVMRKAWHCYVRFPRLLFDEGLSGHVDEKILIQLDTEPQDYDYTPDRIIINKFDVFTTLVTTPASILLSQKLYAILNRPRKQGRDYYDIVFLMSKGIQPDYKYLELKTGISDSGPLKDSIIEASKSLDFEKVATDVEPFLFDQNDKKKVINFLDYFRQSFY